MVLFRAVDIGAELFAMSAACVRAMMLKETEQNEEAVLLADTFCRLARLKIASKFDDLYGPEDEAMNKAARAVLEGRHAWLERGIIDPAERPANDAATAGMRPSAHTIRREVAGIG